MTKKHYKFDMECSGELYAEVFGKNYLNKCFSNEAVVEINGAKFTHHITQASESRHYRDGSVVKLEGYLSKAPTEKELLEVIIEKLTVELEQVKKKLEKLN